MEEYLNDSTIGSFDDSDAKTSLIINLLTINYYRIYNFILSLVVNQADAEDIMQETSTILWKKRDTFIPGSDFVSWALTIAKYRILSHRKSKKLAVPLDDNILELLVDESKQNLHQVDDRVEALRNCVRKLQPEEQNLIHLRYQEGGTSSVVANRTGLSIHQVYRKLARINGLLLRCIRQSLFEKGLA